MSTDLVVGRRLFTNGSRRDVCLDADGQYVIDDGVKVYGVWLTPEDDEADRPIISMI
jgi:hypothetical protein